MARPLGEVQAITHSGTPVLLTVVAEEVRSGANEPPAQSTTVQLALIPPSPTWTIPYFSSPEYKGTLDENSPPGTRLNLSTKINGEPGEVITLQLINNNGTFDINPTVVEGTSNFSIIVRNSRMLDYEKTHSVQVS